MVCYKRLGPSDAESRRSSGRLSANFFQRIPHSHKAGVHPFGRDNLIFRMQVGGGKAERSADAASGDGGSDKAIRSREDLGGMSRLPVFEKPADGGAGTNDAALVLVQVNGGVGNLKHIKAVFLSELPEGLKGSASSVAECKIGAFDNSPGSKSRRKKPAHEVFGGLIQERKGVSNHNQHVCAAPLQQKSLQRKGGQDSGAFLRMEHSSRMGVERYRNQRRSGPVCGLPCCPKDGLMAPMDPVKVADCQNGPFRCHLFYFRVG